MSRVEDCGRGWRAKLGSRIWSFWLGTSGVEGECLRFRKLSCTGTEQARSSGFRNRAQRHSHLGNHSGRGIGKSDSSSPNFDRHVLKSSAVAPFVAKATKTPTNPRPKKPSPMFSPDRNQVTVCESKRLQLSCAKGAGKPRLVLC